MVPALPDFERIDEVFESTLAQKLALIEELRTTLGKAGIQCPGVLVVGAQSAGKSSVLERLTGISFPRSENTCTRVPTIVQLQTSHTQKPVSYVSRDPGFENARECKSNNDIQKAILDFSKEITSPSVPLKDEPIHIRMIRNKGPVMTFIDLPGITHVDLDTGGNFDIHGVTSSMVDKYVSNENMVVLVVIPANDDFGNAEALRIAQKYDKDGKRTIGVVTKCDLVPEKSDILHKIRMDRPSDVKLSLGFIAVCNKGPSDEEEGPRDVEEELFATHPLLKMLIPEQKGYLTLTQRIVDLQSKRVDEFIPDARKLVFEKIKALEAEIFALGRMPSTPAERRALLTDLLCTTQEQVTLLIKSQKIADSALQISARTCEYFEEYAESIRKELPHFLSCEYGAHLRTRLKDVKGYTLSNFMSDSLFRTEIRGMLLDRTFPESTDGLIVSVEEYMCGVFEKIVRKSSFSSKFPKICQAVLDEVCEVLSSACSNARKAVDSVLTAETSHVFTMNPAYANTINAVRRSVLISMEAATIQESYAVHLRGSSNKLVEEKAKKDLEVQGILQAHNIDPLFVKLWATSIMARPSGPKDEESVYDLQVSIHCYVDVLLKRLFDIIPMIIRDKLIYNLNDRFFQHMQNTFHSDEILATLIEENNAVTRKRSDLKSVLRSMRESMKKLRAI